MWKVKHIINVLNNIKLSPLISQKLVSLRKLSHIQLTNYLWMLCLISRYLLMKHFFQILAFFIFPIWKNLKRRHLIFHTRWKWRICLKSTINMSNLRNYHNYYQKRLPAINDPQPFVICDFVLGEYWILSNIWLVLPNKLHTYNH